MLPTNRRISASMQSRPKDDHELSLREEWYARKEEWVKDGCPSSAPSKHAFDFVDRKLSDYLWNRAKGEIEADRKAHPRAKRNAAVGSEKPGGGGRILP